MDCIGLMETKMGTTIFRDINTDRISVGHLGDTTAYRL